MTLRQGKGETEEVERTGERGREEGRKGGRRER